MEEKAIRGSAGLALKAGLWYVISNFLVKGMAFITTPIFSRMMSGADYGEFSNYASWQTILLIITGAELQNTLSRAYYDYPEDYDGYVSSVTVASCLLTAVVYGLFLLCKDWIYSIVAIPPEFVHFMFLTLMFQSCKGIWFARERTLYRYKSVAAVSMLNLVIPTLIAVMLVIFLPTEYRLAGRIYGTYLPMTIIGFVCAVTMVHKGRSFKFDHVKYAFTLSLPLLVHYLTVSLLASSNTIVTKSVLGAEAAGVISITNGAIQIVSILFQAVSGAVTTWLMDNLDQKNDVAARKGTLLYTIGVVVVTTGVVLIGPELIWILGGDKYAAAVPLIPGMLLGIVFQSVATIFNIILTYDKNVVKTAVFTGAVAVISIFAKILLLPGMGCTVLAWINAAAFGALFVINYILVKQAGYGQFVNLKLIAAAIAACVIFVAMSSFLYQNNLIRYGILALAAVVACAVLFKYRHLVLHLVKSKLDKKKSEE